MTGIPDAAQIPGGLETLALGFGGPEVLGVSERLHDLLFRV